MSASLRAMRVPIITDPATAIVEIKANELGSIS